MPPPPKPPKPTKTAGTNAAETIVGGNTPDAIDAMAGDDILFGYGDGSGVGGTAPAIDPDGGGADDADVLQGGDGNDTVYGGGGDDELKGGGGDDQLYGGSGDDDIQGGAGFDTAHFSGDFRDTSVSSGRKGTTTVDGPDGRDSVKGVDALQFDDGTIFLDGRNNRPFAYDDQASTDEDSAVVVSAANGLLANDLDFEGDPLTVTAVEGAASNVGGQITLASGALLTVDADGGYSYDPNGQFESLAVGDSATDSFTYTVSDGNGGADTASVTVTVDGTNSPPVAELDAGGIFDEDTGVSIDVLRNDSDPDGDSLTVTSVTQGANGTVTVAGNGSFVEYTPDADFNGHADFTYTISDGNGGTDTASVFMIVEPVNDAPAAAADTAETDENATVRIDLLANDSDVDGDSLSVVAVDTTATQGMVTNNGTDVTYDPAGQFDYLSAGETATDSFSYTVSDVHGETDTASITVTVDGLSSLDSDGLLFA